MLRLWPKEIQVGLFAERCWLRVGRSGAVRDYAVDAVGGEAALVQLGLMLDDPLNVVPRGAGIVLTVSDALAALMCLPWQADLRSADELRRYAEICFERQGREVGEGWLLHAEYRQFQGHGIAYAFPAIWIGAVEKLLQVRGLHLLRILPASAALYCCAHPRGKGRRLSLLVEAQRCSVLSYSDSLLAAFDVEPVTNSTEESLRRLLRRADGAIAEIAVWTSGATMPASLLAVVGAELPEARLLTLAHERLHSA